MDIVFTYTIVLNHRRRQEMWLLILLSNSENIIMKQKGRDDSFIYALILIKKHK